MAEGKLVYVIDDDSALRIAYATALTGKGYDVKTAGDGLEGEALVKNALPDLIILDMLMPNLDGTAFLKALRQNEQTKDVKVIVVSSFESMPTTEDLGVIKYLSKMLNPPEAVAATVDSILQGA